LQFHMVDCAANSSWNVTTKTQRHTAARPQPNGRAESPPREEGRLRHQENFGAAHLSAADGVVAHKSHSSVSDHPVRSNKEASGHFLDVASTPPREEGTTLVQNLLGLAAQPAGPLW